MPLAVSNSSPLIHLSMVGRISLLRRFSSICIPPAVWQEVVEQGGSRPGAAEIREARESGWLRVVDPSDKILVRLLKQELHAGEAESIALALEVRPDVLLLDETEARRVAGLYGLPVTGIIGLLIQAKREGRISSLAEEMDRLREQGGFWIQDALYRRVLEAEGDSS
jgi:predicted nucleic acid-binding protein